MPTYAGACHCGNLTIVFETGQAPDALEIRACQCAFCTMHGARSVSDPAGRVRVVARAPAETHCYRFALRTADFVVCRRCGAYAAAVMRDGGRSYAIVNVNLLAQARRFTRPAVAVRYDAESEAERRARRAARWTPVAELVGLEDVAPPQ
jgi:hypothetical protein